MNLTSGFLEQTRPRPRAILGALASYKHLHHFNFLPPSTSRFAELLDIYIMSNNFGFGSMPGMESLQDFYSSSQSCQDDLYGFDVSFDSSWMENLDPKLKVPQAPYSWQVQHQFQQQSQLQQPMQRFIQEPERTFFSAAPLATAPQGFFDMARAGAPISTLPRAYQNRMGSPSPSQGALTSTSGSGLSPPAENDWPQDNIFSPQARGEELQRMSQFGHSQQNDFRFEQIQLHGSHVQLSQIQGFSDMTPEEVCYDGDEGYDEMAMKTEYSTETDNRIFKVEGGHSSYRYISDEGLGPSIKDEGSPQNSTIHVEHDALSDADADADGDIDQDSIIGVVNGGDDDDVEYTPKSTRTRKRVASNPKATTPPSNKRSRTTAKSSPNSKAAKGQFQCKSCDHAPFKDAAALQRHNAGTHTRAFICVFAFAGCNSTFASKNEWKRHVSSQHLNLSAWICELQGCAKVLSSPKVGGPPVKGSEFNRKDLFTQHLRRMHAPFAVKRQQKKNPEWEEKLKELAVSCSRVKRQPPQRLACPLAACGALFEGQTCWDDRMEHVGKHLEKVAAMAKSAEVRQENDVLLVQWALREGIIESKQGGNGYRLCSGGRETRVGDEDAEGEEE